MNEIRNLMSDGEYLEALEAATVLLLQEPDNIEIVKQRAILKYHLGDLPDDPFTLRYRGETRRLIRDYLGALKDLTRSNEIEPNDAFKLRYRGETRRLIGDYKGALEDLNKADQIRPNNSFTLCHRGVVKLLLKNYEGALEDLNRADRLDPNDAFTLRFRGEAKRSNGDHRGALEDLNRANELQPNELFTLYHRAIVRYLLSDLPNALEDITRVLLQSPSEEALEWKRKIEEKITQVVENAQPNNTSQHAKEPVKEGLKKEHINSLTNMQDFIVVIRVPFSELKVIKVLGEGGFGEVSLAHRNGMKVALKRLKPSVVVDDMSHEAKTLMLLRYKYIVTLMGITTDPVTNSTILIMEYMKHGSLEDLLFKEEIKLSRASVIRLALDIALGVNYLHSQSPKILHRDLKSANVLLYRNKTRAKIADFGTAKFLHTNVQAATVIGNLIAMPPEMLAEEIYDEKIDVFAFGVILYEMLTNKRLPILEENSHIKRIRDNIGNDQVLMQLVLECCASDPTKRPHMCDIIELLRKMKNESK